MDIQALTTASNQELNISLRTEKENGADYIKPF